MGIYAGMTTEEKQNQECIDMLKEHQKDLEKAKLLSNKKADQFVVVDGEAQLRLYTRGMRRINSKDKRWWV